MAAVDHRPCAVEDGFLGCRCCSPSCAARRLLVAFAGGDRPDLAALVRHHAAWLAIDLLPLPRSLAVVACSGSGRICLDGRRLRCSRSSTSEKMGFVALAAIHDRAQISRMDSPVCHSLLMELRSRWVAGRPRRSSPRGRGSRRQPWLPA
ncbi:hypothetical protein ACLOJK_013828 [Asimina triloba]